MHLNDVLFMLLGAALVAVGVLSNALADRIRGLRVTRETTPRDRAPRAQVASAAIPVVETLVEGPGRTPAESLRTPPAKPPRVVRPEPKAVEHRSSEGDDVIAALIAAGYRKPTAAEATWACSQGERATIEGWTAAALRRCARGGAS